MNSITNNIQITKERLKAWAACADGYRWFLKEFPQGGEFAEVYTALQADKRYDDSGWLSDKVFAELDTPFAVRQTVLISGADKAKIEKAVAGGAEAATTGDWANAATTGHWANVATTGDWANAATTGDWANAATTGYRANAATTGYCANAATTGDWANAATTGDRANAATTGDWANAATTGYRANAATTGYRANAATTGKHAVAAALGIEAKAKASEGGAIVLVHRTDSGDLLQIRASKVGENGIKPNVWYSLDESGVFVEVE